MENEAEVNVPVVATANNATIRQYLAVATTGTFSSASFSIVIVKNLLAGQLF